MDTFESICTNPEEGWCTLPFYWPSKSTLPSWSRLSELTDDAESTFSESECSCSSSGNLIAKSNLQGKDKTTTQCCFKSVHFSNLRNKKITVYYFSCLIDLILSMMVLSDSSDCSGCGTFCSAAGWTFRDNRWKIASWIILAHLQKCSLLWIVPPN